MKIHLPSFFMGILALCTLSANAQNLINPGIWQAFTNPLSRACVRNAVKATLIAEQNGSEDYPLHVWPCGFRKSSPAQSLSERSDSRQ